MHYFNPSFRTSSAAAATPPRKSPFLVQSECGSDGSAFGVRSSNRISLDADSINGSSSSNANVTCHKCGEQFTKWEAAESHHLSKHAGNWRLVVFLGFNYDLGFLFFVVGFG